MVQTSVLAAFTVAIGALSNQVHASPTGIKNENIIAADAAGTVSEPTRIVARQAPQATQVTKVWTLDGDKTVTADMYCPAGYVIQQKSPGVPHAGYSGTDISWIPTLVAGSTIEVTGPLTNWVPKKEKTTLYLWCEQATTRVVARQAPEATQVTKVWTLDGDKTVTADMYCPAGYVVQQKSPGVPHAGYSGTDISWIPTLVAGSTIEVTGPLTNWMPKKEKTTLYMWCEAS